jgi:hypothetical protein
VCNPSQSDTDGDGLGDACDVNDHAIQFSSFDGSVVQWQTDAGYQAYHLYRGSLERLRQSGDYTQDLLAEPQAGHWCWLSIGEQSDGVLPPPGRADFYLVTGEDGAGESSLGNRSDGVARSNTFPCP